MDSQFLIGDISKAQHRDEQSMLNLIKRYNHLLQKYAYSLSNDRSVSYEDAYADLQYGFIVLIQKFPIENDFLNDGAVSRYIEVSMKRVVIRLRRKYLKGNWLSYYNEFTEEEEHGIEDQTGISDDYSGIYINMEARQHLTEKEYNVFYRHYVLKMSIAAIAEHDHITRQVANKTKNRALKKLLDFLL